MMGLAHSVTATGTNDGAKQVSVNAWNADHVINAALDFPIQASDPAVAASGKVNAFAKKFAEAGVMAYRGTTGLAKAVQSALWGPRLRALVAAHSATTFTLIGGLAATFTGTATARSFATTNLFTRAPRVQALSAATAGSLAGVRYGVATITTGDGAGLGGFFVSCRFGCSDTATVAGARQFVGVSNSIAAPTNVEPSTLTNVIGVGHGASDTNLKIFYGGSAAQTPIDLGANFPANTLSTDLYDLTLYAPSDTTGTVHYRVERVNTGHVATGTLSGAATVLPAATTALTILQAWRTNNATALAVGLDFSHVYCETDR